MSRLDRITKDQWQKLALDAKGSVNALAKLCGVSPRQLQRFIRGRQGAHPARWLNEVRMNHAPALLGEGLTVKESAEKLGYYDTSHFTKAFKAFHGQAPSRFVAQGKDSDSGKETGSQP